MYFGTNTADINISDNLVSLFLTDTTTNIILPLWFHAACTLARKCSMHAIELPIANDFSRTLLPSKIPASMIVVASWSVSRARLERVVFLARVQKKEDPRVFHWEFRFTTVRRWIAGRKRGGRTDERAIVRKDKNRGEVCVLSIMRYHSGEHVETDREQVGTFREEIARRTDTSRARSSYPQHPAVVAAAAAAAMVAATKGDKAEHARNSAPFYPYSPSSPSLWWVAATRPPIHLLSSSSLSSTAILLSSVNLCH